MEFVTERLVLRPWEETDAESLYEYAKDPAVGPMAGWPVHKSVEDSREIIKNVLSAEETYAVCLREDNRAIGSVGLIPPAQSHTEVRPGEVEVGYWIGAFEDLNCSAMWCGYDEGNEKSKRCQEKCGFVYHHTEKDKPRELMGDTKTEHFSYLTKEQWMKNTAK